MATGHGKFVSIETLRKAFESSARNWYTMQGAEDLDRTIAAGERLLDRLDAGDASHGMTVMDLCTLMATRWARTPSEESWAKALEFALHWRDSVPVKDWRSPLYILAHGMLLYHRAIVTMAEADVSEAIVALEDARKLVNAKAPVYAASSAFLADLRLRCFAVTGEVIDLESALQDADEVIVCERARLADKMLATKTLAQGLLMRFDLAHSAEDLDWAIKAAKYVLENPDYPHNVAETRAVLASALRHRFRQTHDPQDLKDAIDAYNLVFQETDSGYESSFVAGVTDNLANCYADRYSITKAPADLDQAIACSQRAIARYPANAGEVARVYANLGFSLTIRGQNQKDVAALDEALASFRAGVRVTAMNPDVLPRLHDGAAEALLLKDMLLQTAEHLDEAIAELEQAFSAALKGEEDLPVQYRLGRREGTGIIARRLAGSLLLRAKKNPDTAASDLRRALAIGEAGKVVLLTQELLRRSLPTPAGVSSNDLEYEAMLLARIAAMDVREISPSAEVSPAVRHKRMVDRRKVRSALEELWASMANASAEGKRYVELRQQLPTALIESLDLRSRTHVVASMLETEQLTENGPFRTGLCLLVCWPGRAEPEIVFNVIGNPLSHAKAQLIAEVVEDEGRGEGTETWWQELAGLIRREQPVAEGTIVLSLTEFATGLPWQVIFERAGWTDSRGNPVPLMVVPSLAALALSNRTRPDFGWCEVNDVSKHFGIPDKDHVGEYVRFSLRKQKLPSTEPVVIGNPTADLYSASSEAATVARIVGVQPLVGNEATTGAVADGFANSSLVHIAAHAQFDPDDPLESSILLGDGPLKARDLLGEWNTAKLVVLSACESGADRPVLGGELVGFATALLRSGVQTIVASLWPVDDAATKYLMTRFHQAIARGVPAAKALADASWYVRTQPGWDLVYYWGPFVMLSQRA